MDRQLRVLVFKDQLYYIAQCIDYDICVQAEDIDELKRRFVIQIAAQIEMDLEYGEIPLSTLPETPSVYREMYEKADRIENPFYSSIPRNVQPRIREFIPRDTPWALSPAPHV